jgi:tight adherence protein C
MTSGIVGAGLGLLFVLGALLAVRSSPPLRRIRLADRLGPYLVDVSAPFRLLAGPLEPTGSFGALRRLFAPVLRDAVTVVDRLVGGTSSVRRRLAGLGARASPEEFRIEQVVWGAIGMVGSAVALLLVGLARDGPNVLVVVGGALGGLVAGVLGRDWWLSRALARREETMLAEFPVVADLMALSVVAGESVIEALHRVCRLLDGELARELADALHRARAGEPVAAALTRSAERTTLEPFARFLRGIVVAIERGTPLADVLRAQAVDVREIGKRALLESGGRKEVAMLVPVVFLVLPVTVLFALFPGLLTLTSLAR